MARRQSASLDRKKFFGDPVLVITILALIVFLTLFILYPLAMLLVDSVNWNKIQSASTILWQTSLGKSGATNFYGYAAPLHAGRMNLLTVAGHVASTDPSGLGNYFYARSIGGSATNPQRLMSVVVTGYCDPESQGVPMTGSALKVE